MRTLIVIIVVVYLALTGCVMSVTPDTVDFYFLDGEDTWDESAKSWQKFEREHK